MQHLARFSKCFLGLTALLMLSGCPFEDPIEDNSREEGEYCEESSDCIGSLTCVEQSCQKASVGGQISSDGSCSCGSGQRCYEINGTNRCLDTCSSNADCSTCCGQAGDGAYVCAPDTSYCGGSGGNSGGNNTGTDHQCTDNTSCLTVVQQERGTWCGSETSLAVRVENRCSEDVMIHLCLQRSNGTWQCGVRARASFGESAFQYVCESTGSFQASGHAPEDFGAGCTSKP